MRHYLVTLAMCFAGVVYGSAQTTLIDAPRLYERGMNALTGTGPSHNDQTALDLLRRSADLGYAPAQTALGYFYDTGSLVSSQPGLAADLYRKAAQQDDRLGDWLLGRLYLTGAGLVRDDMLAAKTLQKAADQGDPFGQYLLGTVRLQRSEYAEAAKWFQKAAEQGLPQAQQQLGMLLRQGQVGISQDKFEAYVWLLISYDTGNRTAGGDLALLEADLGSTKVEEAKSKARDMEQTVSRVINARGCTGWPGEFDSIPAPPPPDIQRYCR